MGDICLLFFEWINVLARRYAFCLCDRIEGESGVDDICQLVHAIFIGSIEFYGARYMFVFRIDNCSPVSLGKVKTNF